jgi:glycosidase
VFYGKLNTLKHKYAALRAGDGAAMVRYPTSESQVYAFSRTGSNGTVVVIVNLSGKQVPVKFTSKALKGTFTNYFTKQKENVPTVLKAWDYKVLVKNQ